MYCDRKAQPGGHITGVSERFGEGQGGGSGNLQEREKEQYSNASSGATDKNTENIYTIQKAMSDYKCAGNLYDQDNKFSIKGRM